MQRSDSDRSAAWHAGHASILAAEAQHHLAAQSYDQAMQSLRQAQGFAILAHAYATRAQDEADAAAPGQAWSELLREVGE